MAEKITDGKTGLHFKVKNAVSLANTMQTAIADPQLWQALVNNIPPRLSIERSALEHIAVYEA